MRRSVLLVSAAFALAVAAACSTPSQPSQPSQRRAPPDAAPISSASADGAAGGVAEVPARQIVYDAHLDVRVPDVAVADQHVRDVVATHGGFIAESAIQGAAGTDRVGTFTLRVPADSFRDVLQAIQAMGDLAAIRTNSEDVSPEFYDTGARIGAMRVEEKRLLHHLEASTTTLPEVLQVEHEIGRVHAGIEMLQTRLNTLSRLVAFSTIVVTLREARAILPAFVPGFAARWVDTFVASAVLLRDALEGLAIGAAAVLPWIAILGVPVAIGVGVARRRRAMTTRV